jgi:MerR family transcriptional regulator, light-induced transcriptional regulator
MARYRIKAVSRMLGVRPELLRMWEKRYHLFKPQRAGNRYREFDDEDVQLLRYICQQIDQGRAIGELAAEGREALLRQSAASDAHTPVVQPDHAMLIDTLLEAAQHLDKRRLEAKLAEGAALYSFATLLTAVVTPWMHRLGELWATGQLSMASEHLATVVLIQRLLTMLQATVPVAPAPVLLCACPAGERHELGLLTFAYTMQQAGWHVCYLGADLPLSELQYACQYLQPALVALSLTHVVDQQSCLETVQEIDTLFAGTSPIWIGGQAMARYHHLLHPHWLQLLPSLQAAHTHPPWQTPGLSGTSQVQPEAALVKVAVQQ